MSSSTAAGKAFFHMPGVFAGFETNLRRECWAEGIGSAYGGLRKTGTLPAVA